MIRCVMFDLGNVIAPFDTKRFYSFINRYKTNNLDPAEMLTGKLRYLVRDFELDTLQEFDYYEAVRKAYRLKGTNFEEFCTLLCEILCPDPKMLNLLMGLKQRDLPPVLITNLSRFHLLYFQRVFPEFARQFEEISASCEIGFRKPDAEIWVRPMEKLGVKSEECLFIDDHLPNVDGFRALGGLGFHYDVVNERFEVDVKKLNAARKALFATCRHLGFIRR